MPGGIRTLEVSRDGRWLLAGSQRGAVKAWNLTTGEEILLVPEQGWPSYATFSPDSRLVLFSAVQSVEPIGSIILWDIEKRERVTSITDPWFVGPMAFSRDGRWLGSGVCSLDLQRKILVRDFLQQTNISEVRGRTRFTDSDHGLAWAFGPDNQSIVFSENEPDVASVCVTSVPRASLDIFLGTARRSRPSPPVRTARSWRRALALRTPASDSGISLRSDLWADSPGTRSGSPDSSSRPMAELWLPPARIKPSAFGT